MVLSGVGVKADTKSRRLGYPAVLAGQGDMGGNLGPKVSLGFLDPLQVLVKNMSALPGLRL